MFLWVGSGFMRSKGIEVRLFAELLKPTDWISDYARSLSRLNVGFTANSGFLRSAPPGSFHPLRLVNNLYLSLSLILFAASDVVGGRKPLYFLHSNPAGMFLWFGLLFGRRLRYVLIISDLYPHVLYSNSKLISKFRPIIDRQYRNVFRGSFRILGIDDLMVRKIREFCGGSDDGHVRQCGLFLDGAGLVRHPLPVKAGVIHQTSGRTCHIIAPGHFAGMHARPNGASELLGCIQRLGFSECVIHVTGNSQSTVDFFSDWSPCFSIVHHGFLSNFEYESLVRSVDFGLVMLRDDYSGFCIASKLFDNRLMGLRSIYLGQVGATIRSLSGSRWILDETGEVIVGDIDSTELQSEYLDSVVREVVGL